MIESEPEADKGLVEIAQRSLLPALASAVASGILWLLKKSGFAQAASKESPQDVAVVEFSAARARIRKAPVPKVVKTKEKRRKQLSPPAITRLRDLCEKGLYRCVCCGNALFSSDAEFWPSRKSGRWTKASFERKSPMKKPGLIFVMMLALVAVGAAGRHGLMLGQDRPSPDSRLAVVWSSGDPEVANKVCLMYTHNAKRQRWFDEVTLIVWGPSAKLLAMDKDLQAKVKSMSDDGVKIQACQACSDSYGVSDQLRRLGIDVQYMGKPLTDMLKQGWKVLTF
jgi:hypothetical protein